jgi:hypothetical protein
MLKPVLPPLDSGFRRNDDDVFGIAAWIAGSRPATMMEFGMGFEQPSCVVTRPDRVTHSIGLSS